MVLIGREQIRIHLKRKSPHIREHTGGNEAGVKLVLIQPFLRCYVNHVVLMQMGIFLSVP